MNESWETYLTKAKVLLRSDERPTCGARATASSHRWRKGYMVARAPRSAMEAPALCPERVTVRTKEGVGLSLQIDIICRESASSSS